jgi:hypothetical protein
MICSSRAAIVIQNALNILYSSFSEFCTLWRKIHDTNDKAEYYEAIKSARQRIWIYQTWLTGIETDAAEMVYSKAHDIRLLLLSFEKSSPIYSRLRGRRMKVPGAKHNSASSVKPFIESRRTDCVRFNYAHHPGWIAVIDSFVFWGPTPIDRDSHSVEFLFHKHPVASPEGSFWLNQFKLLWEKYSHNLEEERKYNEELLDLMSESSPPNQGLQRTDSTLC